MKFDGVFALALVAFLVKVSASPVGSDGQLVRASSVINEDVIISKNQPVKEGVLYLDDDTNDEERDDVDIVRVKRAPLCKEASIEAGEPETNCDDDSNAPPSDHGGMRSLPAHSSYDHKGHDAYPKGSGSHGSVGKEDYGKGGHVHGEGDSHEHDASHEHESKPKGDHDHSGYNKGDAGSSHEYHTKGSHDSHARSR